MRTFTEVTKGNLKWLESKALARQTWLLHAFSTRIGGSSRPPTKGLNLGFTASDRRAVVENNRKSFFGALNARQFALAEVHQVHSARVYQVLDGTRHKVEYRPSGFVMPPGSRPFVPKGDALVTDQPGILLSIRSADCMPIFIVDRRRRAVAAIHAGWRGALARIVEKTVGEMIRLFDSRPRDLLAAIGPSIRACCYGVGDEVVNEFCSSFANGETFFRSAPEDRVETEPRYQLLFLSSAPPGHGPQPAPTLHLDLIAAAREQLHSAGVSNIHVAEFCTACRTDLFFSHRKEGDESGRAMAVIGIRPAARTGP